MLHRSIGIEPPAFIVAGPRVTGVSLSPTPVVASHREQPGFYRKLLYRLARLISGVVAHSRKRLRGSAHSVGNVPDAWIFSFQGSLSRKALRKLNLRIPFAVRFVLSPFNGHFLPFVRYHAKYIFAFCGSWCDCVMHALPGHAVLRSIRSLAFPLDEAFLKDRTLAVRQRFAECVCEFCREHLESMRCRVSSSHADSSMLPPSRMASRLRTGPMVCCFAYSRRICFS